MITTPIRARPRVIALLNAKPGTGKTTCAVWLTAALIEQGHRTLLVDADPGASALRWSDLTEGLGWPVVGLAKRSLDRDLGDLRGNWDAVVIDCPQIEDHAAIAAAALRASGEGDWVVPLAPAGIELDRMLATTELLDKVAAESGRAGRRWALLNRCNRRRPSRTGPDADARAILTEQGYRVFGAQVPHSDGRYRQTYGLPPGQAAAEPPWSLIAAELWTGEAPHAAA